VHYISGTSFLLSLKTAGRQRILYTWQGFELRRIQQFMPFIGISNAHARPGAMHSDVVSYVRRLPVQRQLTT
jgi:hypothetical protein